MKNEENEEKLESEELVDMKDEQSEKIDEEIDQNNKLLKKEKIKNGLKLSLGCISLVLSGGLFGYFIGKNKKSKNDDLEVDYEEVSSDNEEE